MIFYFTPITNALTALKDYTATRRMPVYKPEHWSTYFSLDCTAMAVVHITGWRTGFKKISHTQTLQQMAGLSLVDANAITVGVLDGRPMSVTVASDAIARELADSLRELGADAAVDGERAI